MSNLPMPRHDQTYGRVERDDGETFEVVGLIWHSPDEYDYWPGSYVVEHPMWDRTNMALIIPKSIAPTIESAISLAGAAPLEQVKSQVLSITKERGDIVSYPSKDGWILIA